MAEPVSRKPSPWATRFTYRDNEMTDGQRWWSQAYAPGGDGQKVVTNEEREKQRKRDSSTVKEAKPGSSATSNKSASEQKTDAAVTTTTTTGGDPAGTSYPGGVRNGNTTMTGTVKALGLMDSVVAGEPMSRLDVTSLPSNQGQFEDAQSTLERSRNQDKLEHNVYAHSQSSHFSLGFESKYDTPAQIKITLDPILSKTATDTDLAAFRNFETSQMGYIDCFILQNVRLVQEERYFVFQALNGDTTTFFFGDKPVVYNFSGILLDTKNQQWFNDFDFFYKKYLRGSSSILNKTRVFMIYSDQIIEGFMLNVQMSKEGSWTDQSSFSFDFLLIQKTVIGSSYKDPITRITSDQKQFVADVQTAAYRFAQQLLTMYDGESVTSVGDLWKSKVLTNPPFDFAPIFGILGQTALDLVEQPPEGRYDGGEVRNRTIRKREHPQEQVPVEGGRVREWNDSTVTKEERTRGASATKVPVDSPNAPPFGV